MSPKDSLTTSISPSERGVVVSLVGSASMDLCDQLHKTLEDACQSRPPLLIIDLTGLEFICSLGLGAIVVAYLRVQKNGGRVALVGPSEAIQNVLTATKLGNLMTIYPTIEDAHTGR